jgi:c-di-GMP-binding flagellar brake protein YcgR
MSTIDRRSGSERRDVPRFSVKIDVEWESARGRKRGTLSDISVGGCYVLSSGEVEDGERVRLFLPLSDGMKVQFWGEVVNHIYELGFAMRFSELGTGQADFLVKFIETLNPQKGA